MLAATAAAAVSTFVETPRPPTDGSVDDHQDRCVWRGARRAGFHPLPRRRRRRARCIDRLVVLATTVVGGGGGDDDPPVTPGGDRGLEETDGALRYVAGVPRRSPASRR